MNASLKRSHLWSYVTLLPPFRKNMRLAENSQQFVNTLLDIGDGKFPNTDNFIDIRKIGIWLPSEEALIEKLWPNVHNIAGYSCTKIAERALLAPTKVAGNVLNQLILQQIQTQVIIAYFYNRLAIFIFM